MKNLISDEYRTLLQNYRTKRADWGGTGRKYGEEVAAYAREMGCESILDYGCGNQSLKLTLPRYLRYAGYDPAIEEYSHFPEGEWDLICCIDVMEHVEEDCVDAVLERIHAAAEVGVYFLISLVAAKAVLPDGRNAHITLLEPEEWYEKLNKFNWGWSRAIIKDKFIKFIARKRSYQDVE